MKFEHVMEEKGWYMIVAMDVLSYVRSCMGGIVCITYTPKCKLEVNGSFDTMTLRDHHMQFYLFVYMVT